MKTTHKRLALALIFVGSSLCFHACKKDPPLSTASEPVYSITFNFNWNSTDFPTDYPSNPHFSKLIGWSHNDTSTFADTNTYATPGIKVMAETGATNPLDDEYNAKIAAGEGLDMRIGDPLGSGTGQVTIHLKVSNTHPSVSAVTMIAPSPDWFVGIQNVNLLNNGVFVDSLTVNAYSYDAGTDNGTSFTSANAATTPAQPITFITNPPLGDSVNVPVLATVSIRKQ